MKNQPMMIMKHLFWGFWWAGLRFVKPGLYWSRNGSNTRVVPIPDRLPPHCVPFPEQTTVIAESQPEYESIPSHLVGNDEGEAIWCWRLNVWDRLRLLWTGELWHNVWTFQNPLQPQMISVKKPDMMCVCACSEPECPVVGVYISGSECARCGVGHMKPAVDKAQEGG